MPWPATKPASYEGGEDGLSPFVTERVNQLRRERSAPRDNDSAGYFQRWGRWGWGDDPLGFIGIDASGAEKTAKGRLHLDKRERDREQAIQDRLRRSRIDAEARDSEYRISNIAEGWRQQAEWRGMERDFGRSIDIRAAENLTYRQEQERLGRGVSAFGKMNEQATIEHVGAKGRLGSEIAAQQRVHDTLGDTDPRELERRLEIEHQIARLKDEVGPSGYGSGRKDDRLGGEKAVAYREAATTWPKAAIAATKRQRPLLRSPIPPSKCYQSTRWSARMPASNSTPTRFVRYRRSAPPRPRGSSKSKRRPYGRQRLGNQPGYQQAFTNPAKEAAADVARFNVDVAAQATHIKQDLDGSLVTRLSNAYQRAAMEQAGIIMDTIACGRRHSAESEPAGGTAGFGRRETGR